MLILVLAYCTVGTMLKSNGKGTKRVENIPLV